MSQCLSEKNIRAGLGTAAKYKDDNIMLSWSSFIVIILFFLKLMALIVVATVTIATMMMSVMHDVMFISVC